MWSQIIFGVLGAVVGAVMAGYVVPVYIQQPEAPAAPVVETVSMTETMPESMSMDQMVAELAQLEGDEFDLAFLELMIEHHQAAVEMAELVLERSENAELRAMASEIIEAQSAEIEQMEAWQEAWVGSDE